MTPELLLPILTSFATEVSNYIEQASSLEAKDAGLKAFIASFPVQTPSINFDDIENASPEELVAMRHRLTVRLAKINDHLEMHYYASKSTNNANPTDLASERTRLLATFKTLKGFITANVLTVEHFTNAGIPVALVKKGRALEAQPTLDIPKVQSSTVRLRANSKRIRLIIDGVQAPEENLSAAILSNLQMTHDEFKAIYGPDYQASHTVEIKGHTVSLIVTDTEEDDDED